MNNVAWLILLCVGWGFAFGYLFGRAERRDKTKPAKSIAWDAYWNRSYPPVEERAEKIYASFKYDGIGTKPAWFQGGNSNRQDDARVQARKELRQAGHTGGC